MTAKVLRGKNFIKTLLSKLGTGFGLFSTVRQRFHQKPTTGQFCPLLPKLSQHTFLINYKILTVSLRSILIYFNSIKQLEYQETFCCMFCSFLDAKYFYEFLVICTRLSHSRTNAIYSAMLVEQRRKTGAKCCLYHIHYVPPISMCCLFKMEDTTRKCAGGQQEIESAKKLSSYINSELLMGTSVNQK